MTRGQMNRTQLRHSFSVIEPKSVNHGGAGGAVGGPLSPGMAVLAVGGVGFK